MQDLHAHRLKMLKKARQMQTRTADVVHHHMDLFIVGGLMEQLQIEFLHQLREQDRICVGHSVHLKIIALPARPMTI